MSMKFVKNKKYLKVIFRQIRDLRGKKKKKKNRKPNLIRSEEKNDIKDEFLDSGNRSKGVRRRSADQNSNRDNDRGETRNQASPTLTFLFSALKEATNS